MNWQPWFHTSEELSTHRARALAARVEPLVETGRVKPLLTVPTCQLWQLVVGPVQDVEADVTLLHALEALVDVLLPEELVSYLGFRAHQLNKAIWCP